MDTDQHKKKEKQNTLCDVSCLKIVKRVLCRLIFIVDTYDKTFPTLSCFYILPLRDELEVETSFYKRETLVFQEPGCLEAKQTNLDRKTYLRSWTRALLKLCLKLSTRR